MRIRFVHAVFCVSSSSLRSSSIDHPIVLDATYPREVGGSRVVWTADVLPHEAAEGIAAMMKAGASAMTGALARLAAESAPQE
jgi:hypothetical protein